MIRLHLIALACIFALPAMAEGIPPVEPPPKPEPPRVVVTDDGDSILTPYKAQHYGFCCTWHDAPRYHTAAGRDPLQAALQCQARVMSYAGDLPQCDPLIGAQIDRAERKE